MTNKLQQYFPMIRTREEVLNEIESKSRLKNLFYEWTEENQNEFLDFCTGVKGIKIMYDFMIKEILNPENTPERVNELLTLLLGQRVRIVDVLPNDGTRLADESTLLITDMVVQLEDGSIANLEIQKIGYYFPGERSACYSADLLLRQYKRVRGIKGKRFSYRDIKQVYTIVVFLSSFLTSPHPSDSTALSGSLSPSAYHQSSALLYSCLTPAILSKTSASPLRYSGRHHKPVHTFL